MMGGGQPAIGLPMLPGPPTPLLPAVSLRALLDLAPPGEVLGAWVRGCRRVLRLQTGGCGHVSHILATHDLGFLLRRCARIAIRAGPNIVVITAERLIAWRTLQIVVSAPYLPDLQQLRTLYPGLRVNGCRIAVTIGHDSGQAALALCAARRVPVSATWVDYSGVPAGGIESG